VAHTSFFMYAPQPAQALQLTWRIHKKQCLRHPWNWKKVTNSQQTTPRGEGFQLGRGRPCRFRPPEQLPIEFSGASKRVEDLPWTCFKPRKSQR
jgi:hypothetical protein